MKKRFKFIVSEAIKLTPSEFIIWIGQKELLFLKARAGSGVEILFRCTVSEPIEDNLEKCLSSLAYSLGYFGQPLTIVLNAKCYAYIKEIGKLDTSKLFERLKLINDPDYSVNYKIREHKNKTHLVYEAFEREFITRLLTITESTGMSVCRVVSASLLLFEGLGDTTQDNYVGDFQLTDYEHLVFAWDELGNALSVLHEETSVDSVRDRVDVLFNRKDYKCELFEASKKDKQTAHTASLSSILRNGLRRLSWHKNAMEQSSRLKSARLFQVALNSSRLLAVVLVSVNVLLGLLLFFLAISTEPSDSSLDEYQAAYSRKYALQLSVDSLNVLIKNSDSQEYNTNIAAIVSLFCQRSIAGLYLTQLVLRTNSSDSIQIEVAGKARTERNVFAYRATLDSLFHPLTFRMNSITPVVVTDLGKQDTLLNFKLSALSSNE